MTATLHNYDTLAARLKVMGDPVRLRILELLPESPDCEHRNNVSQLSELLEISQPTLSHHLKLLKGVGLVHCKKMCRDVFYWRDREAVLSAVEEIRNALGE